MKDNQLYDLLVKIDNGYKPTYYEKRELITVKHIRWSGINRIPGCMDLLVTLTNLDLSFNHNLTDISALSGLMGLTSLDLKQTGVRDISVLSELTGLTNLDLSNNEKLTDISVLSNLKSLTNLNLGGTNVSDISALSGLKGLTHLDLRNLILTMIPEWLLDLELDFLSEPKPKGKGIYIYGLHLTEQPIEIFSQSRELIIEYYESIKSKSAIPINECKVVFLGDGGAGKSLIIDRLMNDGGISYDYNGESTPGICIRSKKYEINNEEITLRFWDFGGQAIMHSMHQLFLTKRTLYVVVTNARYNKQNEQAWYWIRNIKGFANGAPVLLLVNQKDQNPSAKVNDNGLRKEYPELKQVGIVSALKDTEEEFNKNISAVICQIVSDMETVHTPFSRSWLSLMNELQEMPNDYITSEEFYRMCSQNGIETNKVILDGLIKWYQDLGVCFYSNAHPFSAQYMVLKPRWLLNALYILIFNGRTYAENGIISEKVIYTIICENIPGDVIKKVWPDIKYGPLETQYIINIMLSFKLIYRLDNTHFFMPMLCDVDEKIAVDEIVSPSAYHHIYRYAFLPATVIHRLMIDMQTNIDYQYLWYSGFVLRNEERNQIAYLHIRGNDLHIYIDSNEKLYNPNEILMPIRDKVNDINIELGLNAKEYVTYRLNGREAEFDYAFLLDLMKYENYNIYDQELDSVVDIRTILNRFDQVLRQKDYVPVETKPVPIGETDYESVINGFYYVDKTLLIKDVIDDHNKVYLFTRPRRFGKTLAMDMLYKFFDKTNNSINLFKERKIWNAGQKYRDYQGKYPVIYISFKDASANRWEDMYKIIYEIIWEEYERYEELLNSAIISTWDKDYILRILRREASPSELLFSLQRLSRMLWRHNNHKTIIIIDEYDTPIQSGFLNGFYNEVIGFIRTLFSSALKDNNTLEFGFLTGILRIAKESIFSGLNNVSVNTILDTKYSEYFGFTETEVSDMASYYGKTEELPEIRRWYNGYYFGGTYIYNPWSVINYFDKGCTPEPYWGRTGTNQIISQIIHNSDITTKDDLSSLMSGQEVIKRIDLDIIYPEVNAKGDVLFSFLLVTGYLKIRKLISKNINNTTCSLRIPNLEIRKYFNDEIFKQLSTLFPGSLIGNFENALLEKNSKKLTETLEEYLMNSASTFDTAHENFYHGTVYGMLAVLSERYYIKSNGESGEGRSDIQLEPRNKNDVGYIIEFKAGKNKTSDELTNKAKEAIKQIYNKQYLTELAYHEIKEICLFGIAFSGKHAKVLKEYVEVEKGENGKWIINNTIKDY